MQAEDPVEDGGLDRLANGRSHQRKSAKSANSRILSRLVSATYKAELYCHEISFIKIEMLMMSISHDFHSELVAAVLKSASFASDSASQNEVVFPVLETVCSTASGFTLPFTVTFCSFKSTSNDSTPEK
ncbi:hypothetical protein M5K25_021422 [Dendrobium thyrsiflorum]|uniref:Uncharacterized protein n=1 Tax=Dendrobium thyrsiflorum TaxID=117978 RepID=A0ABD0UJR0_DENTH